MAHQPTYHLWSIGCQMNEADALRAASLLERAGFIPAAAADEADFHVLNTCVVRQQAEDKIHVKLQQLGVQKKRNPNLRIALMGCFVGRTDAQRAAVLEAYPFVDVCMPPSDVTPLAFYLEDHFALDAAVEAAALPDSRQAVSAYVPVVLGCSHACTYCIIPYRRGPERSRPSADVLAEVEALAARGVKEVMLLGQIVDRYGLDREGEMHLPALLKRVAAVPGILRVRFLTSHPSWMTPELIAAVAETPGLCPHFEVPVQAGADAVLAAMKRGYTAADYRALVARIREKVPGAGISTDIIVGFPGETAAQFEETLTLMRETAPDMIRIAKYSPRPQTYSARHLPDDVPPEEKERRRVALDVLLRELLTARHKAWVGREVEILVESIEGGEGPKKGRRRGRTPEHKLVFVEGSDAQPGELIHARIHWAGPYSFLAKAVSAR